ncbi:phosphoadenosine phosphosulfate reductase [Aliiroseovarius sp. 2305UL8-7]|uniref:phosphoadenosine phosphosulfate reductase n=1 Tax=Aliiroseovarius conchicola TaxID=3121637 RepID=UPI00352786C2
MQGETPAGGGSVDLATVSNEKWLDVIEDLGEERGYFEPLGAKHSAILTDEGSTLVVTFETIEEIRKSTPLHQPRGWDIVRGNGWSNLCVLAHEDTWFRDRAVYGFFDRLIEDGFFEEFEKVIFYGAGMCGYAAATFSIVAPDVTVIAVQPQATLDATRAEFDRRYPTSRRLRFDDRYGFAPDMIELAQDVFILFDPAISQDTVHASAFEQGNVRHIRCRRLGRSLGRALWNMGVTQRLIEQAAEGTLSRMSCYQTLRIRHRYMPYLRNLLTGVEAKGKPLMVRRLAAPVVAQRNAPHFKQALERANAALGETGD